MTELVVLISEFGLPVIVGAAVLYLLLRGEIHFSYHRGFGGCGTGSPGSRQAVGARRGGSQPARYPVSRPIGTDKSATRLLKNDRVWR